jgi:hypothetical protein
MAKSMLRDPNTGYDTFSAKDEIKIHVLGVSDAMQALYFK